MDYAPIVHDFLEQLGIKNCDLIPVSGDASFRSYWRVKSEKGNHILMLAPPEKEATKPFIRIARHLRAQGFIAPEIYAVEENLGLVLLEDLGSDLLTGLLEANSSRERELYTLCVDTLIALHQHPQMRKETSGLNLPEYDAAVLLREAMLFADWYLPAISQAHHAPEFEALMCDLIDAHPQPTTHFVHRDYHVSNLMLLQQQRLGLLDFQDALWGAPAYDIVSLLEDARRGVSPKIQQEMREYFMEKIGANRVEFEASYAFLGAQRNLKILGIFVRLWKRDGKAQYLPLIPRVWNYLWQDVEHPNLASLKTWLKTRVQSYEVVA